MADLGPAVGEAMVASLSGVPWPAFVECPVDLLYDEATIRSWYADAAGKGTTIAGRALRWYLQRHANGMFAGARAPCAPGEHVNPVASSAPSSRRRAAASGRPVLVNVWLDNTEFRQGSISM